MITRYLVIALVLLGLGSVTTVRAEALGIRGTVKGTDGKALAGAQVRAERLDGKGAAVVTTTNAKGEYNFTHLELAPYKVTTVVNKVPQSVASIRTRNTGWVRVDFDLHATAGKSAPKKKRMVWVSGETGSHIGGGHWETVEEPATGNGASSVERVDGASLRTQNLLNPSGGSSGPSH